MIDIDGVTYEGADLDQIDATLNKAGTYGTENLDDDVKIALLKEFLRTHSERKKQAEKPTTGSKKGKLVTNQTYEEMLAEIETLDSIPSLKTGFNEFDEKQGLSVGTLTVVYAYSGHGKTSMMLKYMQSFMNRNAPGEVAVMYINFENSNKRLKKKLCQAFRLSTSEAITHQKIDLYAKNNSMAFVHANNYFDKKEEYIHLEDIEPELIEPFKALNKGKTIVVFIDYIQMIDVRSDKQNFDRIKLISKTLKAIADRDNEEIIVIAGAQENKDGGMRESDDIRQSADNIVNLYNIPSAEAEKDAKVRKQAIEPKVQEFSDKMKAKGKQVVLKHVVKNRDDHFKGSLEDVFVLSDGDVVAHTYWGPTKGYIPANPTPLPNQQNTKALNQANQAVELKKEEKKEPVKRY